nr:hypothetical protein [Tanacetum cinerariifolium]
MWIRHGELRTICCVDNDVISLQALVNKKKVVVTEAAIRELLRLDDAEGVDCLPNEEIFTELACMGYEKPSTKLTFYKAFFSSQWKFLIHTILQSISAKRTLWNEFSSAIASAVICLSTEGVDCLPNEENFAELACMGYEKPSTKLTFYKAFFSSQWKFLIYTILQLMSAKRTSWNEFSSVMASTVICLSTGKGFSGVETPLFKGMIVGQVTEEGGAVEDHVEDDTAAQGDDTTA